MKKRLLATFLCGTMIAGMMSGCGSAANTNSSGDSAEGAETQSDDSSAGSDSADSGEKKTISFAYQYDYEVAQEVVEAYEKEHPEIEIEYRTLSEDDQEMVTKMTGNSFEDVYVIPSILSVSELPNYMAPVGNAEELAEEYYYGDYMNVDGQAYGFPIGVVYEGMLYNQEVLDEYYGGKVPTTLDELYDCCKVLAENDIIPFWLNAGSEWPIRYWDNLAITLSGDDDYANDIVTNQEPWSEGEPLREAETILATLAANGWVEKDVVTGDQWDTTCASIAMGKCAFILTGSWAVAYIQNLVKEMGGNPDAIQFGPFPYKNDVSSDSPLRMRVANDLFLGVNKNAEYLEEAIDFARYFCENIPPYIGSNGIQKENGFIQENLESLAGLDYVEFYSSPARDAAISEMGGNCKIDVYQYDAFLLDYIILPAVQEGNADAAQFDKLNELWKSNF
ncbi:MAG: ABC transporter substrate-binding protein [Oliverpabstia sp.]